MKMSTPIEMVRVQSDAPVAAQPVLQLRDLTISLPAGADREFAVESISFDVQAGQTVCLLGESGSGKSIIANAVMGLLPSGLVPAGGSIRLRGRELVGATQSEFRELRGPGIAMVFQEPMTALNPVMTCGRQIDEMLTQHVRMTPAARRRAILDIMARVRLPDPERIFDAYPHQLSGGQRQRIVIAIALILKPALLICDEPTTALDVTTQAEILRLIRELQVENGTAVLFITHDFGVVAEIADEVVVLQLGQLIECGEKAAVLTQPREAYTQMLLDAVPDLQPRRTARHSTAAPLLEVRALAKTYTTGTWFGNHRQIHAVKNVSLTVGPNETVGIVGESGSGKSTVARSIARLIDPSAGEIRAAGRAVDKLHGRALSPHRRDVQVVFQDPYRSLNPRQTVGSSIIEGPLNFGVSRDTAWRRAEELMHLVRLKPEALRRYPSEFSGGQRQRICIARALACEPKLLIADEAVSALDVSVQAQILRLLEDIQQQTSIGILFVTHDLRVASQICDRVIVMHQGAIVEQGSVSDVFARPQQEYTRRLLEAAPGRNFSFARRAT